jgi:hypothetical protein
MTKCAYCAHETKMTREHVIPSFLYDFQKTLSEDITGWNEVAGKMVGGESKVKDVCEECNGKKLSVLDNEGKRMLKEAGLLTKNYENKSIQIKFDFDLLVRWILKISFNSTRTDGAHTYMFEPHIPYILGGAPRIKRSEIAILAYFAAPLVLDRQERHQGIFSGVVNGDGLINPFLVRIGYGQTLNAENYLARMVTFGPLVFYILIFKHDVLPGHAAAAVRKFKVNNIGAVEITPQMRMLALKAGNQTWIDLYEAQIQRLIRINGARN